MADLSNSTINEQRMSAFRFRGQSITYRQTSDTVNRGTGVVTPSNTDTAISDPGALVGQKSTQDVSMSGGKYRMGDRVFKILNDDMPETPPKLTSKIIFSGDTFDIVDYKESHGGNVWEVVGRKA